ncbi:hypothetical protein BC567DRAFT_294911 [Phyllosticta citribraziliensis]
MSVMREHHEGASLQQLLTLIPEETHWVWHMLPLFEKHRNQEVYAFMGTCRKLDQNQDFLTVPHAERGLTLQLLTYRDKKKPEAPTSQYSDKRAPLFEKCGAIGDVGRFGALRHQKKGGINSPAQADPMGTNCTIFSKKIAEFFSKAMSDPSVSPTPEAVYDQIATYVAKHSKYTIPPRGFSSQGLLYYELMLLEGDEDDVKAAKLLKRKAPGAEKAQRQVEKKDMACP